MTKIVGLWTRPLSKAFALLPKKKTVMRKVMDRSYKRYLHWLSDFWRLCRILNYSGIKMVRVKKCPLAMLDHDHHGKPRQEFRHLAEYPAA